MVASLKTFEEYGIDEEHGFLSPRMHERLPAEFEPWEALVASVPAHLLTKQLQSAANKLPMLSPDSLTLLQKRRAFSILTLLANAYVWASENNEVACNRLPEAIATPLLQVSESLGINPVVCHATVVLWNWTKVDPLGPLCLDNIRCNNLFTGSMDEAWFYLVTAAVEIAAIPSTKAIFRAFKGVEQGDHAALKEALEAMGATMKKMTEALMRMRERCDPYVFYLRVRKYVTGSENCDALPEGLYYGNETTPRQYAGGSAAQSTSIQAFDVALGVQHTSRTTKFLLNMRPHMPREHRQFLEDLEAQPSIKRFIEESPESVKEGLKQAFNDCLKEMETFRSKHIQLATSYILAQSRKGAEKGTGGSGIMDLLKGSRSETTEQLFH